LKVPAVDPAVRSRLAGVAGPYRELHTVGYNGVPANVRTGATITRKFL